MSIELCNAAAAGNFEEVRRLIEEQGADPNFLDPNNKRPIDFAAQNGHLDIIEYLVSQKATLSSREIDSVNNLLTWICSCTNIDKRKAMLAWLLRNNCYEQLECEIQKEHVHAAYGFYPLDGNLGTQDSKGFFPCHYAALAGENPEPWYSRKLEFNKYLRKGYGFTVAFILASKKHRELLKQHMEHNEIKLNAVCSFSHSHTPSDGITLAMQLINNGYFDLLYAYMQAHPEATLNLKAAYLSDNYYTNKGMTLAYLLVIKGYFVFLENYLRADHDATIDLNAAPLADNHPKKNVTLASLLISEGHIGFLQNYLAAHRDTKVDLTVTFAFTSDQKPIALAEYLVNENKFSLFTQIIAAYNPEEIANLANKFRGAEPSIIYDYCQLVLIQHHHQELSALLQNQEAITKIDPKELQEYLISVFQPLFTINEKSIYYKEIQSEIGHILLDCKYHSKLEEVLYEVLKDNIARDHTFNSLFLVENQLHFFMSRTLLRGDKDTQETGLQLIAEKYAENDKLKEENSAIKKENHALKERIRELEALRPPSAALKDTKCSQLRLFTGKRKEPELEEENKEDENRKKQPLPKIAKIAEPKPFSLNNGA